MDELKGVPITLEHVDKKELYPAVAYSHSSGCPFIVVFSMEEIVLKLLLGDFVRGFPVKIDQLTN